MTLPVGEIICGDCLQEMERWPNECIDLIVTSPPYNLRTSSGNGFRGSGVSSKWPDAALRHGYGEHADNMPYDEYCAWQYKCLCEMMRILKPTGAIFYNQKWRVQKGLLEDRSKIISDFPVRQIIIWSRGSGMNFNRSYFVPTYEPIYLIANPGFQLRDKAAGLGDVWMVPPETAKNKHPAPFPEEIPSRCIRSTDAQLILDPFLGSGTTAAAAKRLGRQYIGIELNQEYCEMARRRLAQGALLMGAKG